MSWDEEHDGTAGLIARMAPAPAGTRRRRRRPRAYLAALAGVCVLAVAVAVPPAMTAAAVVHQGVSGWKELPDDLPDEDPIPTYTVLLDANGQQFAQFYSENRIPVGIDDISPHFLDALIATEDARFAEHNGIDVPGLLRAAANNVRGGSRQGGSTITQQLVENIRLVHAQDGAAELDAKAGSIPGKIQEAKYAVALEERYTKDEILEMYSNTVYFGSGTYGVATAAHRYWGVSAADLTLGQAATLAGLVKNPNGYDPITHPQAAQERRDVVLGRMLAEAKITQAEHDAAVAETLTTTPGTFDNGCYDSAYPLYCAFVMREILTDPAFGATPEEREYRLYTGGMTITTALDPKAMAAAQGAVDTALGQDNRVAAAVAVVQPGTGHVQAIAQNRTYGQGPGQTELVYATSAFQTGSSFKAITLAAALEQGISPRLQMGSPSHYRPRGVDAPAGGFTNFAYAGHGSIDAYTATRVSSNTWYVQLTERVGVRAVADMARRLGVESVPDDLTGREASITLGAYESSPLEMAAAYATFASGGIQCAPTPITAVRATDTGEEMAAPDPGCGRVLMPGVAATVNEVLAEPMNPGGTAQDIDLGRPAAGKTGTANNLSAAWFVGHTPHAAAAVWVGDPRGGMAHPLQDVWAYGRHYWGVGGGDIAAPIWEQTMRDLLDGVPADGFTSASAPVQSLRSAAVPDTRGMRLEQAVVTLRQAGMSVVTAPETAATPGLIPDTVAAQSVEAGQATLTLTAGSAVELIGAEVVDDGDSVLVRPRQEAP